jgi:hypothetical protein
MVTRPDNSVQATICMLVSLLELGVKYHITNSTVLELIQSILLLSFAVGVFPTGIHRDALIWPLFAAPLSEIPVTISQTLA